MEEEPQSRKHTRRARGDRLHALHRSLDASAVDAILAESSLEIGPRLDHAGEAVQITQ